MSDQVPLGPNDKYCPLFRKRADKVCHTCMWWTYIGLDADPQKPGAQRAHYTCAQNATFVATMSAGREQRAANATMQQATATIKDGHAASQAAIVGMTEMFNRVAAPVAPQIPAPDQPKKLLEG